MNDMFYIYSDLYRALWRPDAQGYADSIKDAGCWAYDDAYVMTQDCPATDKIKLCRFIPGPEISLNTLQPYEKAVAIVPDGWLVYWETENRTSRRA